MNIETFQSLILDSQKNRPALTSRDVDVPLLKRMSVSIVGARRSGKTFRTYQVIHDMIEAGIKTENICRVQFNDHRLAGLSANRLSVVDEAYYSLYPEKKSSGETVLFIFDEIQRVDGWEDYVLNLIDSSSHRVICTGSTSKMLKGEIAAGLRGKNFPLELLPFSFREFLRHYGIDEDTVSTEGKSHLRNQFKKYLTQGGFPGLLDLDEFRHIDMLQTYWDTMILRDIVEAHPNDTMNITTFTLFARSLLSRIACPMTIRKIAANLHEAGIRFSIETLYKYLSYLEESFMVFTVPYFSPSENIRNRNYRKPYAIDWALGGAIAPAGAVSPSRMLENAVFVELKRRGNDIYYLKTRKSEEIDFIAVSRKKRGAGTSELIQVCLQVDNQETFEREIRGLPEAASFIGNNHATLVTMDNDRTIEKNGCTINIVPAWKWFL